MSTAHVNKEYLDGLRERFDAGHAPITMSELDAPIRYAQEAEQYQAKVEAWMRSIPNIGGRP